MNDWPGHPADRGFWRRQLPALAAFVLLPALIELTLSAADLGLIANTRLRLTAYQNGAFWAGLLDNWRPNYAGQPELMFVTYSFLHAGLWHLVGNMLSLLFLMRLTAGELGGWRFLLVYVVSAIGGALGFALLGTALNPMVGASGAIFGLAGAWRWMEWRLIAKPRDRALVALRDIALLSALNAIMWLMQDRALAWEAHLGGFIAGAAVMAALPRRRQAQ
ncbi:rhomboid family intramembrane serine protease [Seohaeicola zhoushanensis]|uniref:Rhomboid family intramembrane serine protease n=1 Tax=Seohaeicola zhoushanensis TaxID=1569283 RepID=A0A8J3GUM4_9RHOB|nr:rhomboid family intramembrane serine protease [Seohaeicola zhoushanensis]GHF36714.1 rhomboid family intramembrane serine protease [Seohaeicola zhoushanensis]